MRPDDAHGSLPPDRAIASSSAATLRRLRFHNSESSGQYLQRAD